MPASRPREQLLLVDDEEDALLELAELLENEGFRCHVATVITDLNMPEESGISLIKRLREHTARQHLPVIVTTGHANLDAVTELRQLEVLDLFRKPIYHIRLLETLGNLFPPEVAQGRRVAH